MKKLIFILLMTIIPSLCFSYSYPLRFDDTMKQICSDDLKIEIVVGDNSFKGKILSSRYDYCIFKLDNGDVVIIRYEAIDFIYFLEE